MNLSERPMGDPDHPVSNSLENIKQLVDLLRPVVDSASKLTWKVSDGFWLLVCRCVLRRQFDALEAIVGLVRRGEAHSSVPLLRPACEEFLWIKYIGTLEPELRELVILQKSQIETADTLDAQRAYAGDELMQEYGFTMEFMDGVRKNRRSAQMTLKAAKKQLKWPTKPEFLPSANFLARVTNEKELYDLIYHATSRTVHFTVSELLRRAWGDATEVTISSHYMAGYWSKFSLYWGWRIFFFTFVEIINAFESLSVSLPNIADETRFDLLMREFAAPGIMPIITPVEMNMHIPSRQRHLYIDPA
jgi:Family of unknown function (DUF5677)